VPHGSKLCACLRLGLRDLSFDRVRPFLHSTPLSCARRRNWRGNSTCPVFHGLLCALALKAPYTKSAWPFLRECPAFRATGLNERVFWPTSRDAAQYPFRADVLVNVGPMNPLAVADDLEVPALFVRRLGQPPRPRAGHTDHPSIHEMGRDFQPQCSCQLSSILARLDRMIRRIRLSSFAEKP